MTRSPWPGDRAGRGAEGNAAAGGPGRAMHADVSRAKSQHNHQELTPAEMEADSLASWRLGIALARWLR